jgi:hypothetical protein
MPVPPPPIVVAPAYGPLGVWFDADYLLWWTKDAHVGALATPPVSSSAGAIGPASAQTLFGGGDVDFGARSGGRFTLGVWFVDSQVLGLEGSYFFLADRTTSLAFGLEDTSSPGAPQGTFAVSLSNELQSAEINLVATMAKSTCCRLEVLSGFRFLELEDRLHALQDFTSADGSEDDLWEDVIRTRNDFYGGQVGLRAEWIHDRLSLDAWGKVALGVTNQQVAFDGALTQTLTGQVTDSFGNVIQTVQVNQSSGGLIFQPTSFHRDRFTVVPEVGVSAGCQLTSYLRASLGYSFLYWSSVARAGDQTTGVPKATDFWAQGLNVGLSFRF